jgi:hypothetical protein
MSWFLPLIMMSMGALVVDIGVAPNSVTENDTSSGIRDSFSRQYSGLKFQKKEQGPLLKSCRLN